MDVVGITSLWLFAFLEDDVERRQQIACGSPHGRGSDGHASFGHDPLPVDLSKNSHPGPSNAREV